MPKVRCRLDSHKMRLILNLKIDTLGRDEKFRSPPYI